MPHHVPEHTKKERTHRLISLGHELSLAFHQQYEGQTLPVLWESNIGADEGGLLWSGYTDNYIRVQAHGPADLTNRVTPTRLFEAKAEGMSGEIIA
jgi:tRNA A37 methylthiotransferase MiaB